MGHKLTDEQKKRWAIRNALSPAEKDLIAYYELQWTMRAHVPTVDEVTAYLAKTHRNVTQISVNYYLTKRPNVYNALNKRGIPWQQHSQRDLTPIQIATASLMMNFNDPRTNAQKLAALGVNPTQYNAWLSDPQFKSLIQAHRDNNLANIDGVAITEYSKAINNGDAWAVKHYIDTTGAVESPNAPQSEVILIQIIEVLQRHIKDPQLLGAISSDLLRVSQNRTLAIEGEFVEDPSVADARKQLNI